LAFHQCEPSLKSTSPTSQNDDANGLLWQTFLARFPFSIFYQLADQPQKPQHPPHPPLTQPPPLARFPLAFSAIWLVSQFSNNRRIQIERLPTYAPELNPQEGVWNLLKRVELKNVCCLNLQHIRIDRKSKSFSCK
jgi:hypothetical protein